MFRTGQWVKAGKAVGIWMPERRDVQLPTGQVAQQLVDTVHWVDEKGETTKVTLPPAGVVAVDKVTDIPEPRRSHLPANYNPATKKLDPPK